MQRKIRRDGKIGQLILSVILLTSVLVAKGQAGDGSQNGSIGESLCNPMNLSYRFCLDTPSRREAADPTMVNFKGEYYLFASKSGGYWHSTDLKSWDLIQPKGLPLEDYAPTAVVMGDTLFFMASTDNPAIYKTADPKSGQWTVAKAALPVGPVTDPCLFLDDDGRLYLYYGCSDVHPTYGIEIDRATLSPIGEPKPLLKSNIKQYGWERKGDYNDAAGNPWIEGSWMNKHNGKYYLQYAGPGTQYKSYSDGVYVSTSPLGPFKLGKNNPFSYKPEGFIDGAGHGSTFKDNYGNYWHVATMTISVKHMFERRLGLFPVFFDKDGEMSAYTGFGDFPYYIPARKIEDPKDLFANWMLLSYKKPVTVSSELPGHPKGLAADEDIRTYWSAATGDKGEWLSIDLGKSCRINALQINFAENDTHLFGRDTTRKFKYYVQYSTDGKRWEPLLDKTEGDDLSQDYTQLSIPVVARYLKLTNFGVPDGSFALSDFRVFGNDHTAPPQKAAQLKVHREAKDRTKVRLCWKGSKGATGYNIRYGTSRDKLYHNYQVLGVQSVNINSLNALGSYYFTVDAFNGGGITTGTAVQKAD